jgi:hypothetical protein
MADGVRMLETINAYRILVENPEGWEYGAE